MLTITHSPFNILLIKRDGKYFKLKVVTHPCTDLIDIVGSIRVKIV